MGNLRERMPTKYQNSHERSEKSLQKIKLVSTLSPGVMVKPGRGAEVAGGSFGMGVGANVLFLSSPAPRLLHKHAAWTCVDVTARHHSGGLPSEVREKEKENRVTSWGKGRKGERWMMKEKVE